MSPVVVAVAAVGGVLLGPLLRGQILRHAVPAGEPWRSECPRCAYPLVQSGWRGQFPILSPTGRCPSCQVRVGPRPGVVEVVTATILGALAWRVDDPLPLLALCWVAAVGVILAAVDIAVHRLPDRLALTAFLGAFVLLGAAALVDDRLGADRTAVLCSLAVGVFYLALVLISPAGMGLGDAKAAFTVGIVTGWFGWAVALVGALAGFVLAGLYATGLLILRRAGRKDHIPHGPFMLAGALAAVLLAA